MVECVLCVVLAPNGTGTRFKNCNRTQESNPEKQARYAKSGHRHIERVGIIDAIPGVGGAHCVLNGECEQTQHYGCNASG